MSLKAEAILYWNGYRGAYPHTSARCALLKLVARNSTIAKYKIAFIAC